MVYSLPGWEKTFGGISQDSFGSRADAIDALQWRITAKGTIKNRL